MTGVPKSSYLYFQTFSLAESKNCYVVVVFVVDGGGGGVLSLFEGALTNGIFALICDTYWYFCFPVWRSIRDATFSSKYTTMILAS